MDCYDMAGKDYHIDPDLLRAISFRESSFKPDAINISNNERYAIGLMQIHLQNFNELNQYGITAHQLRSDPCLNIYTEAYYLTKFIKLTGNIWEGVGAYNAGTSQKPEQQKKRRKICH
ncbi:putative transglycosylase [Xenorhabdus vietnamensis]|uniref:Putative transglycosylase n=1 Tax=Xenorhabdus vietnamensis TaxID=351656 RepID=A0A1Y2SA62_9GAMM|nr:putative transglycosylase [Xenorhabdus vietnamensis]